MDNNGNSSRSNQTCGVDMTMEGLILHDQLPYDLVCPNYPLQTHQVMPTSSHVINPAFSTGNQPGNSSQREQRQEEEPEEELGAMKEMMYKIAAMQPVDIDPATIQKPKRRNVRISNDPQSVAARHRRERISEKIRILQRLVPGGTKMDTATMLDEAIRYVKFLKRQVHELQSNEQSMPMPFAPHNIAGGIIGNLSAMDYEALGITSPFSSSVQPPAIGAAGFTIRAIGGGGNGGGDNPCGTLCFNHQDDQVIRINDSSD